MTNYCDFLASKRVRADSFGFDCDESELPDYLFNFQRRIVAWAVRKGRAAIFAGCGLGKTIMQLTWANRVQRHTGGSVLILAPLAVAAQTRDEGARFGIAARVVRSQAECSEPGIYVTNYEMLEHFDAAAFVGVVLDESSILKSFMGATKRAIIDAFARTPYRLACTATPAPNDHLELGNHAQFLGVMASNEMIARWFVNDPMEAGNYRLKGHAEADFWNWVHSWAVSLEAPSDLGFSDDGFQLPPMVEREIVTRADVTQGAADGMLFRVGSLSATTVHDEMRRTCDERARALADLVRAEPEEQWLIYCNTDYEADALTKELPDATEVRGSDSPAEKERAALAFASGTLRVLISKPRIFGFGMNFQSCARVAFVGLSYSFEQLYQAIRRCWRFGQKREVHAYIVRADSEGEVLAAIREKGAKHEEMKKAMNDAMRREQLNDGMRDDALRTTTIKEYASGAAWRLIHGDCVEALRAMPSNSVHLTVTSPPFSNLYIYSDAAEDMGNSADDGEFLKHFGYLAAELHRVTVPGRIVALHCKDLPLYKGRDGSAGLRDFPGDLLRVMEGAGFTFHSRVTIWKCPVTEMQRTKNHGLLYKNLRADSSVSRQGMADYVLAFRKWEGLEDGSTKSEEPVEHSREDIPLEQWQAWASPVWMDVNQMRVLDYKDAKDNRDERHICPLQLDVIERCVVLWSNRGDLVLDPFNGIGSTGYESIRLGRKYVGTELKPSYLRWAETNLRRAERESRHPVLFSGCGTIGPAPSAAATPSAAGEAVAPAVEERIRGDAPSLPSTPARRGA